MDFCYFPTSFELNWLTYKWFGMSRNSIEIFLALMDNILILIFGTAPTGLIYLIVVLKLVLFWTPFSQLKFTGTTLSQFQPQPFDSKF